jgi:hypothetical protein
MFGRVTDDLRGDIFSLLSSEALAIAAHEDSQGLRRQGTANSWIVIEDTESSRKEWPSSSHNYHRPDHSGDLGHVHPIILLLHNGFLGFTIVKLLPFIPAL